MGFRVSIFAADIVAAHFVSFPRMGASLTVLWSDSPFEAEELQGVNKPDYEERTRLELIISSVSFCGETLSTALHTTHLLTPGSPRGSLTAASGRCPLRIS